MDLYYQDIKMKRVAIWLFSSCFLIWLMIMLGGATRLTHAGLSIVEWKPITGILPPLTETAWNLEFEKYQQFPEYKTINYGMSLTDFKFIYFMEYAHRLLGRLIGLFFFFPLVYFWGRGYFTTQTKKRLTFVCLLGLAQGLMGWYMVKSGLVHEPTVSPYRLTMHLLLALALLGILFWTALDQKEKHKTPHPLFSFRDKILVHLSATAIMVTITYGGFVAGLKAGKIYNTYPLMGGQFLPSEWNFISPVFLNFFENPATVQWVHRTIAIVTLCLVLIAMIRVLRSSISSVTNRAAILMIALIILQVLLGITTLLLEVPVLLGTLHQGFGVLVFMMSLYMIFLLRGIYPS